MCLCDRTQLCECGGGSVVKGWGGRGAGKTVTFRREQERLRRIGPPIQIRNVVYTGAIWGGVQINDSIVSIEARQVEYAMSNGKYAGAWDREVAALADMMLVEVE